jgi:RNase P subunit RPR2
MIVKDRDSSLEIYRFEALIRRLPLNHRMMENIQLDFKRRRSGIRGEKEIEFPLGFLDEQDYLILHNLRIADGNGYFQIDTLIITGKYILILEVKNWYGTILFGENGQVTRIGDDGIEEGFPNPIPQVKLQKYRLQKWLYKHGFSKIPLHFFVVISFPSTIIKSISSRYSIPNEVIHNNNLFFNIQELDEVYMLSKLKRSAMIKLSKQLCKAHTPSSEDIMEKYNISINELVKGIICSNCLSLPMTKIHGKWLCEKCNYISVDAYIEALKDYQLLIGNYISNQEARMFLLLESPYVTKNLLQREKLKRVGNTRKRKYELDFIRMPNSYINIPNLAPQIPDEMPSSLESATNPLE